MPLASYAVFILLGLGAEAHVGKVGSTATKGSWVRRSLTVGNKGDRVGEEDSTKLMRSNDHTLFEVSSDGHTVRKQEVHAAEKVQWSCGGHTAPSCNACGSQQWLCNGDCTWIEGQCVVLNDGLGARNVEPFPWHGFYTSSDGYMVFLKQYGHDGTAAAKDSEDDPDWLVKVEMYNDKIRGDWSANGNFADPTQYPIGRLINQNQSINWTDGITWNKTVFAMFNETTEAGRSVTVGFGNPGTAQKYDWIGLYKRGEVPSEANDQSLVDWAHTDKSTCDPCVQEPNAVDMGTVTFTVSAGDYDIYYFPDDGFDPLAGPIELDVMESTGGYIPPFEWNLPADYGVQ